MGQCPTQAMEMRQADMRSWGAVNSPLLTFGSGRLDGDRAQILRTGQARQGHLWHTETTAEVATGNAKSEEMLEETLEPHYKPHQSELVDSYETHLYREIF